MRSNINQVSWAESVAAMQSGDQLAALGTDAMKWAEFFAYQHSVIYPNEPTPDTGWLVGYFANAIGAGEMAARQTAIDKVCICNEERPFHSEKCPAHNITFGWPEPVKTIEKEKTDDNA